MLEFACEHKIHWNLCGQRSNRDSRFATPRSEGFGSQCALLSEPVRWGPRLASKLQAPSFEFGRPADSFVGPSQRFVANPRRNRTKASTNSFVHYTGIEFSRILMPNASVVHWLQFLDKARDLLT